MKCWRVDEWGTSKGGDQMEFRQREHVHRNSANLSSSHTTITDINRHPQLVSEPLGSKRTVGATGLTSHHEFHLSFRMLAAHASNRTKKRRIYTPETIPSDDPVAPFLLHRPTEKKTVYSTAEQHVRTCAPVAKSRPPLSSSWRSEKPAPDLLLSSHHSKLRGSTARLSR